MAVSGADHGEFIKLVYGNDNKFATVDSAHFQMDTDMRISVGSKRGRYLIVVAPALQARFRESIEAWNVGWVFVHPKDDDAAT